jgi:hypothetical protein
VCTRENGSHDLSLSVQTPLYFNLSYYSGNDWIRI